MPELYQNLLYLHCYCKYHVVFMPKKRRNVLHGYILGVYCPIYDTLARQKEYSIIEGLFERTMFMCALKYLRNMPWRQPSVLLRARVQLLVSLIKDAMASLSQLRMKSVSK